MDTTIYLSAKLAFFIMVMIVIALVFIMGVSIGFYRGWMARHRKGFIRFEFEDKQTSEPNQKINSI
jgi:hypothetical protein